MSIPVETPCSNKFHFPEIFFFRHFSKNCSVFYKLKTKFFFRNDQNFFPNFFFESSCKDPLMMSDFWGG
jgi:hypothetical protein